MMATVSARLASTEWARPAAMGTRATMVPTLVPIESDMKQAARKRPGNIMLAGNRLRARLTVASTAPIAFADAANAPASTYIHSMSMRLLAPAPRL